MNRKALLLYLKDIRDLEFAKKRIETIYSSEKGSYISKKRELEREYYEYYVPRYVGLEITLVILAVIGFFLGYIFLHDAKELKIIAGLLKFLGDVCVWLSFGFVVFAIVLFFKDLREKRIIQQRNNTRIEDYLMDQIVCENMTKKWTQREAMLLREISKVKKILNETYSINIIPSQYRNIQSIYYIYEYMSTSQASFEETLIHEHMENGIQRIMAKLDTIISQNQMIIFQNRRTEAANQRLIDQNVQMLISLKETEANSAIAAQYAEISSNYSKANAYFSLANYLK